MRGQYPLSLVSRLWPLVRALAVLLVLWQLAIWLFQPPHYILPSPSQVLSALVRQPGFFLSHSLITVSEIVLGFVLGAGLGALAAIAMAAIPRLGQYVWPVLLLFQALPVFVIAPLLVVWFGFGMASKVIMAMLIIFFPVTSSFADGLRRTDPELLDATALTQATHWQTLFHVRLPLAMPSLLSGLRVAAPLAPLGAVVGEWVGSAAGLGFVMVQANARMQTDVVFAAMTILAILSVALFHLINGLGPRMVPWATNQ
ncbi:ABC transporter permease [Aureimonas fodinaquatilis]|uniref:ABC transporter permease n=1 Tax=Aureimonas fodinaquatilis TaxID=2565783 RepID=A0A5B0E1D4_9HYPH|nr:ABC transporter permease [Aureimonas fodinaquatilis]KAA0972653.1 ABC transporter permease [Aureimonas fodinaquatilis]